MRYIITRTAIGLRQEMPSEAKSFSEAQSVINNYLSRDLYWLDHRATVSRRKRGYRIWSGTQYAKVHIYPVR